MLQPSAGRPGSAPGGVLVGDTKPLAGGIDPGHSHSFNDRMSEHLAAYRSKYEANLITVIETVGFVTIVRVTWKAIRPFRRVDGNRTNAASDEPESGDVLRAEIVHAGAPDQGHGPLHLGGEVGEHLFDTGFASSPQSV